LAAATPRSALANPAYVTTVEQRLAGLEQAHNAFVGLYAVNLETGNSVVHRAQDSFAVCSTFKGSARTRRRACAPGCPAAGQRVLLALMTRSQVDDPHAQNLRLLIGELTAFLVPEMLA
jgi:hypothetical protein